MSDENTVENQDEKTYTQEELDAIIAEKIESVKGEIEKPLKEKLNEFRETNVNLLKEAKEREASEEKKKLLEEGKFKEYEENIRASLEREKAEALEPMQKKIDELNNVLLGTKKEALLNELLVKFDDDHKDTASLVLNNMIDTKFNDELEIEQTYKSASGEVVATSSTDFLNYLQKQPAFQKMLRGVDMNGGGAAEKRGGGAANMNAQKAKENKDLGAFLNAKIQQNVKR